MRFRQFIPVLLTAAGLAGCGAVQAGTVARSPDASSSVVTARQAAMHSAALVRRYRLGLDLDFYNYYGRNIGSYAQADVRYAKSLHANALSVSFPFFVAGPRASSVFASSVTPSPAELAIVVQNARKAGLYVSIRPLLDEQNLRKAHSSRVAYLPRYLGRWFASYERFLRPYAQMAQRYRIPELITGAEFDSFGNSPYWTQLDRYLRRYYHGTLAYSDNWSTRIASLVNRAGVLQLDDAYPMMNEPNWATVAQLTRAWDKYLSSRPHGLVLSEVGIAAQAGAYRVPFTWAFKGEPLEPRIQVRWFDAICNAVANERDSGVYFWSYNLGQALNVPPNTSDPMSWVDGPGQKAIAACFTRLG